MPGPRNGALARKEIISMSIRDKNREMAKKTAKAVGKYLDRLWQERVYEMAKEQVTRA